jgi:8-hydroxy-5-deazaflavin:NADPH oxidoreductase
MKIGILGSGVVGQQLAIGFIKSGHEVQIGTREPEKLKDFLSGHNGKISAVNSSDATKWAEVIVIATKWTGTENAIKLAGIENFKGKIVVDVTNPIVFKEQGKAPVLDIAYPGSAGQHIQNLLPDSKVVKAFNIVTAHYMASPKLQEGTPVMFFAGNDEGAKKTVIEIAKNWGWDVSDLGGIDQAYLMEAIAMTWIRYGFLNNYWNHAFALLKK